MIAICPDCKCPSKESKFQYVLCNECRVVRNRRNSSRRMRLYKKRKPRQEAVNAFTAMERKLELMRMDLNIMIHALRKAGIDVPKTLGNKWMEKMREGGHL